VVKDDGLPYTVFTPYSKKWLARLKPYYFKAYPTEKYFKNWAKLETVEQIIDIQLIGFQLIKYYNYPKRLIKKSIIQTYNSTRDYPSQDATSKLGLHLRFGTLSIRRLLAETLQLNKTYVNELIWRDFYHAITWHFKHIGEGKAFKPAYDNVDWLNSPTQYEAWCAGKTGYPIVDAGMRQLNATGYMHNRVRMITASFLIKHLLIDWRWGEAYFAEKLLDFDFAANNGGWQWAASSGCDAAPYFRVFNPALQQEKFDKDYAYVKQWVPEYGTNSYPEPIVDHKMARERVLAAYKKALG
jgi:deoxyribodipyrimidine photo-lyase